MFGIGKTLHSLIMNTTNVVLESPVLSWPINALPATLFDLVGEVQKHSPGIDLGQLQPEFEFEGAVLVNPREFRLVHRRRYMPNEPLPLPIWWLNRGVVMWKIYNLPIRLSFLLHKARLHFPGLGFQEIGLETDDEKRHFILRNLTRKV